MLTAGLLLPFAGTTLGAAAVFLMKSTVNKTVERILTGFAAGVMTAASVWSLLLPSIETAPESVPAFLPAAVGFLAGIAFLQVLDRLIARLRKSENGNGGTSHKNLRMMLAVTLHNIPEGMAVGVALAAALDVRSGISPAAAMALSLGIAVQNFPEGAIISMPLQSEGAGKGKAFLLGTLSGAVEPVFGVLTLLLTGFVAAVLPYLLAFAAGAMICVVAEELIPASQNGTRSSLPTAGLALGFVTMMVLDVAFG